MPVLAEPLLPLMLIHLFPALFFLGSHDEQLL